MHEALLDALDAATGPSRELDAAIWLALFEPTCPSHEVMFETEVYDNYLTRDGLTCALGSMWIDQMEPPLHRYTASLECAFALAERLAPHGRFMVERDHAGDGWAMVQLTVNSMRSMAFGKTPALALCSALIDAMQSATTHMSHAPSTEAEHD